MTSKFDEIAEEMDFLEDWEDRYRHVIELGKAMPDLTAEEMVPATRVEGCASQVWLVPRIEGEGETARLHLSGSSDALIVRGLVAVVLALLSGRTARDILDEDVEGQLQRLGLEAHLSAQRSNGLKSMVARVRGLAKSMLDQERVPQ